MSIAWSSFRHAVLTVFCAWRLSSFIPSFMTSITSSRNWSSLFDPRRITAVAPTAIPTRKLKNAPVESFLDIDISYSSFSFHDLHFDSVFVFYIIGAFTQAVTRRRIGLMHVLPSRRFPLFLI